MSAPAILIDTSVLVYAHDTREAEKQARSREAMLWLCNNADPYVSVQVLGEYYSVLTNKLEPAMDPESAERTVAIAADAFTVLSHSLKVVRDAMWASRRYGLNYYDAQIWACAHSAGITAILSEDTPSAPEIEGVRYYNPFAADISLDAMMAELQ